MAKIHFAKGNLPQSHDVFCAGRRVAVIAPGGSGWCAYYWSPKQPSIYTLPTGTAMVKTAAEARGIVLKLACKDYFGA
jgi:hypothetical protein